MRAPARRPFRSPAVTLLMCAAFAAACGDLASGLWRLHTLSQALQRDDAAIGAARLRIAGLSALRARRRALLVHLRHGSLRLAGSWLSDVERAASAHHLALVAVHPVGELLGRRRAPAGFARRAVEVRLRGRWAPLARWVRDLSAAPGTVGLEHLALQPTHDLGDAGAGTLDARAVIARYEPALTEGGAP